MGELAVPLVDWFDGGDVKLWNENLPVSQPVCALRDLVNILLARHPPSYIDPTTPSSIRNDLIPDWFR